MLTVNTAWASPTCFSPSSLLDLHVPSHGNNLVVLNISLLRTRSERARSVSIKAVIDLFFRVAGPPLLVCTEISQAIVQCIAWSDEEVNDSLTCWYFAGSASGRSLSLARACQARLA